MEFQTKTNENNYLKKDNILEIINFLNTHIYCFSYYEDNGCDLDFKGSKIHVYINKDKYKILKETHINLDLNYIELDTDGIVEINMMDFRWYYLGNLGEKRFKIILNNL